MGRVATFGRRAYTSALWRSRPLFTRAGWDLRPIPPHEERGYPPDFDDADRALYEAVKPYTLTPPERVWALRKAVQYIVARGIEGDIVECGVWRGGSMMAAARTLLDLGETDRRLYLFDTYTGMTAPTADDVMYDGSSSERSHADSRTRVAPTRRCRSRGREGEPCSDPIPARAHPLRRGPGRGNHPGRSS